MASMGRRCMAGLAAAMSAVALAGCTTHSSDARRAGGAAPTAPESGLMSDSWTTYHQPPGPMHLSFRHPTSWKATGSTFAASMGNVGIAYLEHNLSRPLGRFPISSRSVVPALWQSVGVVCSSFGVQRLAVPTRSPSRSDVGSSSPFTAGLHDCKFQPSRPSARAGSHLTCPSAS